MDRKLCCAIIGHSPLRFHFGWDEEDEDCIRLKLILLQQIQKLRRSGVTQFMTVCDSGVGLWCGEIVNALRECDDELELYCIPPYEEVSTKWAPYLRKRYFEMLEKCTHIYAVSAHKTPTSKRDAYRYIINKSDILLAVYDSASGDDNADKAVEYAEKKKLPTLLIHPDTFKISLISEKHR